jgi:hypothetical protein
VSLVKTGGIKKSENELFRFDWIRVKNSFQNQSFPSKFFLEAPNNFKKQFLKKYQRIDRSEVKSSTIRSPESIHLSALGSPLRELERDGKAMAVPGCFCCYAQRAD